MQSIRASLSVLQWLLAEAYQYIKWPARFLIKKEELSNALSGGCILYVFLVAPVNGVSLLNPIIVFSKIFALFVSVLFGGVSLLGKIADPAPSFIKIDIERWKNELAMASRKKNDSTLYGMDISQANSSNALDVAILLLEAFGSLGRVFTFNERVEICRLLVRRHPGSVLLLRKNSRTAGCVILIPLAHDTASQFLGGKVCERHFAAKDILTKRQVRQSCPYLLISAIYLKKRYRNPEGRQAIFLALFAAMAKMLLYSNDFLVFCEPVSPNGLKIAQKLGLDQHETHSATRHTIFKFRYKKGEFPRPNTRDTRKYLLEIRTYLRKKKVLPSFLL
jgi:hypothetical protein